MPEDPADHGRLLDERDQAQAAATAESTKGDGEMASTKDVLDHHLKCFGEGDLKGILSDYAPDAVLFTPDGPLKGVDAIAPFFRTREGWARDAAASPPPLKT